MHTTCSTRVCTACVRSVICLSVHVCSRVGGLGPVLHAFCVLLCSAVICLSAHEAPSASLPEHLLLFTPRHSLHGPTFSLCCSHVAHTVVTCTAPSSPR